MWLPHCLNQAAACFLTTFVLVGATGASVIAPEKQDEIIATY